ncbi:rhomboid family intramembrane serine protease [Chitinibacter sp. FCG-7]|uniref:Rhomboid family intramembrane serine protease n=1 Tax=Chitinibacter mangrovi TaxID=3153927 RepID=A0AAU7F911_9NEIS
MLILPLPSAPDWRRPPWVTLGIITLCCFIYLFLQLSDEPIEDKAYTLYYSQKLDQLELPRYLEHLNQTGRSAQAEELKTHKAGKHFTLLSMQADEDFMRRLHNDEIVKRDEAHWANWKNQRTEFEDILAQSFTDRFILKPANPTWYSLLMHMFMHGSIDHLLGNMIVLFIVGYTVEAALGGWRYLAFYMLAGLGATSADLVLTSDSFIGSLGASGAIAGVMAMFVVIYGLRKIRFFYYVIFYMGTLQASALLILLVWLGKELLQKAMNPDSNVNYYAHFCGLLTGALLATLFRWQRGWQTADHVIAEENNIERRKQQAQAEKLLAQLQFEPAARLLAKLAEGEPADHQLLTDFYRTAKMQADTGLRQRACHLVLRQNPGAALTAEAWQQLRDLKAPLPQLSTSDWMRLAVSWIDAGLLHPAETLLSMLIRKASHHVGLSAQLYRLGQAFQRAGNTEGALSCWRTLIRQYPDSPEARLVRKPQ